MLLNDSHTFAELTWQSTFHSQQCSCFLQIPCRLACHLLYARYFMFYAVTNALLVFFVCCLRQDFTMQLWLAQNSLCTLGQSGVCSPPGSASSAVLGCRHEPPCPILSMLLSFSGVLLIYLQCEYFQILLFVQLQFVNLFKFPLYLIVWWAVFPTPLLNCDDFNYFIVVY